MDSREEFEKWAKDKLPDRGSDGFLTDVMMKSFVAGWKNRTRTLEPVVRSVMKSVNQASECVKNNDEEQALFRLSLATVKLESALKEVEG